MITLKEWMELVEYRITEGSDYGWGCYGTNAQSMDSWNGDHDGHSAGIVFDTRTQTVYEVTVCDYSRQRAYRMINPEFKSAYDLEAQTRGCAANEAWDSVEFCDLDVDDDFMQKVLAIRAGETYDTRVQVPLTLDDTELFELMKMAHAQDVSLNTLVETMLREFVDLHSNIPDIDKKKKKKGKN